MGASVLLNLRSGFEKNAEGSSSFDDLAIVRKSRKQDLAKPVAKRRQLSQMLFNASTVEVGLMPEDIQPIMYGLLRNVFKTNRKTGDVIFQPGMDIDSAKRIWDEAAYDVLTMLNHKFEENFTQHFNSRRSEFGCWSYLWEECYNIFEETVDDGGWNNVPTALAAK